jgi:thiol-disulfide isomerase/thioredoxin
MNSMQQIKAVILFCVTGILLVQIISATDESLTNTLATKFTVNENQMIALRTEVDDAESAYLKSGNDKNNEELWTRFCKINDANLPKIFQLAKQEPQSETALDMFGWILMNRRVQIHTLYTNALQSIELLDAYHAANPNIAKICRRLGNFSDSTFQPLTDFLQKAANKNPNRDVRGQATLALARLTKDKASILVDWESDTNSSNSWFEKHKNFILEEEKNGGAKAASLEAENFYHIVLNKYANCPTLQPTNAFQLKSTLGELAKIELFELEHLTVGKTAPELEGEDIDGQKLKLSDYRGKIVVLSFWASWCGPCMQMVPSEVKLAEQMKGKSFALIGINGDANRSDAKHAVEKEKVTWPSFWDEKGSDGIIPTAWNIHGWPTIFVLDSDGVIQLKFEGYGGTNTENLLTEKVSSLLNQLSNKTHS